MSIKLYWWCGGLNKENFGDYLSPLIVEMVSGKKVVYAKPEKADMIAIGSILHRERKAKRFFIPRKLHIWGAGTDSPDRIFPPRHYYHAVRGLETSSRILNKKSEPVHGDPGLLADIWWAGRPKPQKRFRFGLIPHFVDSTDRRVKMLANALPNSQVIDVFDPVEEVLKKIQSCEFILSSSMHGLIVADSFSIPNRRLILSEGIISDFKFIDYYSIFGIKPQKPIRPENILSEENKIQILDEDYFRNKIYEIKERLYNSFPSI